MFRTLVAFALSLLAITGPAHAATVDYLNANLDLIFPKAGLSGYQTLAGNITLTRLTDPYIIAHVGPYHFEGSGFTLDGNPLPFFPASCCGPGSILSDHLFFLSPDLTTGPLDVLALNLANIGSLTPSDFTFGHNIFLGNLSAAGGTVTVISEVVSPVPLPAALPLFGTAIAALGGCGLDQEAAARSGVVAFTLDKLAQALRGMPRDARILIQLADGTLAEVDHVRPGHVGARGGGYLEMQQSTQGAYYGIVLVPKDE